MQVLVPTRHPPTKAAAPPMAEENRRDSSRTSGGEPSFDQRLYDELHAVCARHMAHERGGDPLLQPSMLVSELWMKLRTMHEHASRGRWLADASLAVRRVLVDHARRRDALVRGGAWRRVPENSSLRVQVNGQDPVDVLALHEALERLAELNERHARVIELRYFAGLTEGEIAEVLGVSRGTVSSDGRFARAWLHRELGEGEETA